VSICKKNNPDCTRHKCPDCGESLHTSACNLAAENARLRAALEKIANGPWPDFQEERPCGHPNAVTCPECSIIEAARAALAAKVAR
jgi:hypothetical protein